MPHSSTTTHCIAPSANFADNVVSAKLQCPLSLFPHFRAMPRIKILSNIQAPCIMAFPAGNIEYAWFYQNQCYLVPECIQRLRGPTDLVLTDPAHENLYSRVRTCDASMPFVVPNNTVFAGIRAKGLFCIENVYYFGGIVCDATPLNVKMHMFVPTWACHNEIHKSSSNSAPKEMLLRHEGVIQFGFPLMHTNYRALLEAIPTAAYTTCAIHFIRPAQVCRYAYNPVPAPTHPLPAHVPISNHTPYNDRTRTFWVKAGIGPDHYDLYTYAPTDRRHFTELAQVACIPDYQTSVYMNSRFRIIKENVRIAAHEESDDEGEFENIDETRFLLPGVCLQLLCYYNAKWKSWSPRCALEYNSRVG